MAKQYGFYIDQSNCIGCFTCQIACFFTPLGPTPLSYNKLDEYIQLLAKS